MEVGEGLDTISSVGAGREAITIEIKAMHVKMLELVSFQLLFHADIMGWAMMRNYNIQICTV